MIYALTFIVSALLFAFIGYRQGIVKLAFRLLGLVGAYVSAILFTPPLGNYLNEATGLNGILGFAIAGLGLFFLTSLLLGLAFKLLEALIYKDGAALSKPTRIAGGIAGAVMGCAIGVLLVWGVSIAGQLFDATSSPSRKNTLPQEAGLIEQFARDATSSVLKSAISASTDQPDVAELTAQLLGSPQTTIKHFQGISKSTEFQNLFTKARNQQILNSGDLVKIRQIPEFNQLLRNPHFKEVSRTAFDTSGGVNYDEKMAEKVLDMWARVQFVKEDPETQAVINDAGLKKLMDDGNVLALLNSQKIVDLFKRITSDEATQYSQYLKKAPSSTGLIKTTEESIKNSKLYQWVDEQGVVHYSDKKPDKK